MSVYALALGVFTAAMRQGGGSPAGPALFVLDLRGTPPGDAPASLRLLKGNLEVVLQGGVPMLRATTPSEFLITLPQVLPSDFTLEFDLVPKAGSNPQDLSFEGTSTINQGAASAHLLWHATGYLSVIGGGGDNYETPMPEDLKASLPGALTHVVAVIQGNTVKLYTNGRRHYTLDKRFARGRVLRVFLGAQDDATEAVYLAGLRITAGSAGVIAANPTPPPGQPIPAPTPPTLPPAPPATTQTQAASGGGNRVVPNVAVAQGAGGPVVTWGFLGGVSSYTVKRWMVNNATCCNNASPTLSGPPWQDTPLAVAGTYVYEVTASTPGWVASGQAQFIQFKTAGQIATVTPPAPPAGSLPAARPSATAGGVTRPGTATSPSLAPPTSLIVSGTPVMASLSWQSPAGWTPTGYTVLRKTVGTSVSTLLTTSAISATRFDDQSGFVAGESYEYVVTALSGNPLAFGTAQVQLTPPAPQNVSNLLAQQTGSTVTLSWAAVPGASTYLVTGPAAASQQVPGTQNLTTYSNLAAGTYTWSVGALYNPGAIATPAVSWPSVTFTVLDPNPVLAEGKLYKEVSRPEIYVLHDLKKIHVPTPDALRFMGYSYDDVTTVIDGGLVGYRLFQFASGSPTPGSLLFPPKDVYHPLRGIPNATRVMTQGLETQVGELRGWLWWKEKMDGGCGSSPKVDDDFGDVKYGLELDSEWALRQGINLHDILWVGNVRVGGSIQEPGSRPRSLMSMPIIQIELNSFTWKGRYPWSAVPQRPADWQSAKSCPEGTRYFPFDPDLPNVNLSLVPEIGPEATRGPYVRIVGALVTDSPHTYDLWDAGTAWSRYYAWAGATGEQEWNGAALDWSPGLDPYTDPRHVARWTEVHPPDLIEPVTRDPNLPMVTLKAVALVARPTQCEAAILGVVPEAPRPSPSSVIGWEELRGPETFWPLGENAQNGSWVTDLGNAILVNASVCGGGVGKSPGRFKAFYRVWWK